MPTTYAIPDSRTVFDATTYTGTGASLSVTNAGAFQPDFVWLKSRSADTNHQLFDSVRGTTKVLVSNSLEIETTSANTITSFNSGGFTVGTNTAINTSAATYVGWQWKAGGTAVSNTSGTITSSVSVNTTAGLSIVTYTGTGANATVGHALTAAPSMVIVKNRASATDWVVWQTSFAGTDYLILNATSAVAPAATLWNSTTPTASVFSVGTSTATNASGSSHVAYCWAPVAGFSQFGSYTGNGSTDGPFIYLGFRPKFLMYKRTDSTGSFFLVDSSRNPYNLANYWLQANTNEVEQTDTAIDLLSNGYKVRITGSGTNASAGTYIYAAFAENPFKYSNAR